MATITQAKDLPSARFGGINVAGWLRDAVFGSVWNTIFAVVLVIVNILIIRAGFNAEPVSLSFNFAPNGVPTPLGSFIQTLTSGPLLTSLVIILWLIGLLSVIYGAMQMHWSGPTQWLKDSLYTGPFGALTTLAFVLLIVFAVRGLLSWAVFGAEFRSDPQSVAALKSLTPGAIWGIVAANTKLFAVGQYPNAQLWRVWLSLGIVIALAVSSTLAWGLGSPLKQFRRIIVWGWLASAVIILFLLQGGADTTRWGGFLLTVVLSVAGIVISFPIGIILALGRRSEVRGVPLLWLWGAALLFIYWGFGNFPSQPVTFNIPVIFRDPPLWVLTLSPLTYAVLQLIVVVAIFWAVGYYFKGNMIKTLSILYIEVIRGVPLITVLFMAQILLPIFLPRNLDIDNVLRVVVGIILFSSAYMAENVRGGLQAIPKGQYEAAMAVGLSTAQSMRLIILPQALRLVIPAIVGLCIGLFNDTSLVSIVGLFDLLQIARAVVAQPDWLGLQQETFAFIALVYWVCAFSMSRASQRLEKNLGVGKY
jgi:general L-amino acid transport system permease protein